MVDETRTVLWTTAICIVSIALFMAAAAAYDTLNDDASELANIPTAAEEHLNQTELGKELKPLTDEIRNLALEIAELRRQEAEK